MATQEASQSPPKLVIVAHGEVAVTVAHCISEEEAHVGCAHIGQHVAESHVAPPGRSLPLILRPILSSMIAAMDSVMSDAETPSSWAARPWRKVSCAAASKEAMVASRVRSMETVGTVLGGGGKGDGGGGEGGGGGASGGGGGI